MEDLHAQRREDRVPIQFHLGAYIANRLGFEEQSAALLDVPRQRVSYDNGAPLIGLVEVVDSLLGRGQMDDMKPLEHLQEIRFTAVVRIEDRRLQERRADAVLPIDGNHPMIALEFGIVVVGIGAAQAEEDGSRLFRPRGRGQEVCDQQAGQRQANNQARQVGLGHGKLVR